MRTIIVATDFSPISVNAVNYAADMALSIKATLCILNVVFIPVTVGDFVATGLTLGQMQADAEAELKLLQANVLNRIHHQIDINISSQTGEFFAELQNLCSTVKPFLVVMGGENTGAFARVIFGSKTLQTIRHLMWPILVVPANAGFKTYHKIGLACDFHDIGKSIPAGLVKQFLSLFPGILYVIHVTDNEATVSGRVSEQSAIFEEIFGDLKPHYHAISSQDVQVALANFVQKTGLDVLIVFPKKHGLIGGLFHRSDSKKLVLHSTIPILSIHE